jgi:hypothetical protein
VAPASTLVDASEELDRLSDSFEISGADQPAAADSPLRGSIGELLPPSLVRYGQPGYRVTGCPQYRPALDIQGASPEIDQRRQRIGIPVEYRRRGQLSEANLIGRDRPPETAGQRLDEDVKGCAGGLEPAAK